MCICDGNGALKIYHSLKRRGQSILLNIFKSHISIKVYAFLGRNCCMACDCLKFEKFEKFIENQTETSITLCQWQYRITIQYFPIEETMAACSSTKFFQEINPNIHALEQIPENYVLTSEQWKSKIQDIILPVYFFTKTFKEGLCQNCRRQYQGLQFDHCVQVFQQLGDGNIPEESQDKKTRLIVSLFLNSLKEFNRHYNCVNILLVE